MATTEESVLHEWQITLTHKPQRISELAALA
jgi:hypothetical protein